MTQAIITERDAKRARYVDYTVIRAEMARNRQSDEYRRRLAAAKRRYAPKPASAWKRKMLAGMAFAVLAVRAWKRILREARL